MTSQISNFSFSVNPEAAASFHDDGIVILHAGSGRLYSSSETGARLGTHSVSVEAAIHRGEADQPRVGTGHLRRCPPGDVPLLEAGAVPATISLHGPTAQKARHCCAAGDRLSPAAILFSRLGRSRRPCGVWLASLSEAAQAALCCLAGGDEDDR